jgi:hypothetical protein
MFLLAGCSAINPSSATDTPTPTTPAPPSATPAPPTATDTVIPPTLTYTPTSTVEPTLTLTPTETPTHTALPTPTGDQAIYIYMIQTGNDGPIGCGDTAIPINTGIYRTGDIELDVATALANLFVKRQYIAGLYNPAYLSNIQVDSVNYKVYDSKVEVMLSGTYVRSKDRCDNSRVRAQVWSTIRQFPGVKTVYILLNGNLLGDILGS